MSLRGKKYDGTRPMISFRCPSPLRHYIDETSESTGRDKTEIITEALELDRDLALKLRLDSERLAAMASSEGLNIDRDLAEVLARLVRAGLEARDSASKSKK